MSTTKLVPKADERRRFDPIVAAIRQHRAALAKLEGLVVARPGYDVSRDPIEPALVLAFRPPAPAAAGLEGKFGVRTVVVEANPEEQLRTDADPFAPSEFEEFLAAADAPDFAAQPPTRGAYVRPPAPRLDPFEAPAKVTLAASPDAGWPTLHAFLSEPVQQTLTVGMYQFTADHIYDAIRDNLRGGAAELSMTLHPVPEKIPESGNKAEDVYEPDLLKRLQRYLGSHFTYAWTSVGKTGAFSSAYHIKVAVADQQRFWLSTGNWQSSNQPPYDPINAPGDLPDRFASSYNREYHVVIENAALSRVFDGFLDYDRDRWASFAAAPSVELPDLFVPPEEAPVDFAPRKYFPPKTLDRSIKIQPLLTPDNYAEHVLPLVRGAEHTLYFQNQYINLNSAGNFPEFEDLVSALLDRIRNGVDVRIILRDYMADEKLDMLLALGFPRNVFRFMRNCHAKLIVADGARAVVGSHNWSNDGTVSNRDASLLFDDAETAAYFQEIFLDDWDHRARPRAPVAQPRVARDGEQPFAGATRVEWSAWSDEPPRAVRRIPRRAVAPDAPAAPGAAPASPGAAAAPPPAAVAFGAGAPAAPGGPAAAAADVVTPTGIARATGQPLLPPTPVVALAADIRSAVVAPSPLEVRTAARLKLDTFAAPFWVDPNDLAQTGWAVVFAQTTPPAVRNALAPLLQRRQAAAGKLFRVLEVLPGESASQFLARNNVAPGTMKPHLVPYHLLIVGSPAEISFEFQYLLDLDYSVGRLHFDAGADAYGRYASGVVAYETAATAARKRSLVLYGPRHPGDRATELSSRDLVSALFTGDPQLGPIATRMGVPQQICVAADATRGALLDLLGGGATRPGVVLTAGHGLGCDLADPQQTAAQGALLTQDWPGVGAVADAHRVAAADITDAMDPSGLIAFFFACFGAGTPRTDYFPIAGAPAAIAPGPFVAALPQRLLGHARPALAVVGHVDRAWGFSIKPSGVAQPQLGPYETFLGLVLRGDCVGNATADFHGRAAFLSSQLADALAPGSPALSDYELAWNWIERNDARSYVLLGDPAVRLRQS